MQLHLDRIDNLAATEHLGVIRQLTRKARILFEPSERVPTIVDYDVLSYALDTLDGVGITPMSVLSGVVDPTKRWGSLTLVKRSPALAENDPGVVDVILEYVHLLEGANQQWDEASGTGTPTGILWGKGKCSIVEKTTNFFYPNGDRTDPTKKTMIEVSHKFGPHEHGIAALPTKPNYPRTIWQGGEISIPYPQSNFRFEAVVATVMPTLIAQDLVATINQLPWLGMDEHTWICSEVAWEANSTQGNFAMMFGNPTYKMTFEFQHNVDTWNPAVVFIDQRTGRPPEDVKEANENDVNGILRIFRDPFINPPYDERPAGLWKVPALRPVDFNTYFLALFA